MNRVLFVDDDANILVSYQRSLRKMFEIDTALGGAAALQLIEERGPYTVIMSDMSMPVMNGIEFLQRAKELSPDSVRMMLTGNADLNTAIDALNCGSIFRFLLKPCLPDDLATNLQVGVEQYKLIHAEKELLEKTLQGSVRLLIEILSLVNPDLFGKAQTMRQYMRIISESLGLTDIWKMELAALLSKVGSVTLPPEVLQSMKSGRALTGAEAYIVERVPEISHNLIVKIPRLESVANAILYSAKRFDGGGRPDNDIKGENLPLGARLLRIMEDLTEMLGRGIEGPGAFAIMRMRSGVYDPVLLDKAQKCLAPRTKSLEKMAVGHPHALSLVTTGMLLTADVETTSGILLVSAGHIVTETILERVHNFAALCGIKEPIYTAIVDTVMHSTTQKAA